MITKLTVNILKIKLKLKKGDIYQQFYMSKITSHETESHI